MQGFAQCLKQERELHLWSQEQVAEMIGTTAPSVSRWEHGNTFPGLHFRQKLCELFGKSAEELGFLQDVTSEDNQGLLSQFKDEQPPPLPVPMVNAPIWYVPYRKNPFFTGCPLGTGRDKPCSPVRVREACCSIESAGERPTRSGSHGRGGQTVA
jgi:transcriptional regulator with XRE-family HTH domain